ncbi:hypothetical protein EVAR_6608_1 [Eumeta japonica]|uniref:Uncharacterized protein n=1 Tax=Eumeta variegata TaxID=151549 RepID=A0A4C1TL75_EUMVA|nr:hypothetical protein EVAR_6608_1 [Eumeta japonica]
MFQMPRTRRKHYASHSRTRSRSYEAKRRRLDDSAHEDSYRKRSRTRDRDRHLVLIMHAIAAIKVQPKICSSVEIFICNERYLKVLPDLIALPY